MVARSSTEMIKALNHVGISVADLERSLCFYRDGFDMRVVENQPFGGSRYDQLLGLSNAIGRTAVLERPNFQVELFEFHHPSPLPMAPSRPVSNHGISHFCLEVEDIHSVYERLRLAGASFHCPPLRFAGIATATYGRDPDGNVFELIEMTESL